MYVVEVLAMEIGAFERRGARRFKQSMSPPGRPDFQDRFTSSYTYPSSHKIPKPSEDHYIIRAGTFNKLLQQHKAVHVLASLAIRLASRDDGLKAPPAETPLEFNFNVFQFILKGCIKDSHSVHFVQDVKSVIFSLLNQLLLLHRTSSVGALPVTTCMGFLAL